MLRASGVPDPSVPDISCPEKFEPELARRGQERNSNDAHFTPTPPSHSLPVGLHSHQFVMD